jgi:DNA-binding LacI/PurR family transcriptional regulator
MADVAARSGVSLSTVSRALRGAPGVSSEAQARVVAAAAELAYVVSRGASALVTGRTGRIAVVVPFLRPWFFGVALSGIHAGLRAAGADLVVYEAGDAAELDRCVRDLPLRRNADALIAVSFAPDAYALSRLDGLGLPIVFCSQRVEGFPSVFVDDAAAEESATRNLLNLGHRHIAYVHPRDATGFAWASRLRLNGYRAAMAAAGLPERVVAPACTGSSAGEAAAGELLASERMPTAVLAESDDIAFGVLRALRNAGVDVPGTVSVVGFDDQDAAELFDLTTVAQPVFRLGEAAAELAAELAAGRAPEQAHVELPTRLVIRRTAAAPRGAARPPAGSQAR